MFSVDKNTDDERTVCEALRGIVSQLRPCLSQRDELKYWIFQNSSKWDALRAGGAIYPQWDDGYRTVDSSMEAYRYLLEMFNRKKPHKRKGTDFWLYAVDRKK